VRIEQNTTSPEVYELRKAVEELTDRVGHFMKPFPWGLLTLILFVLDLLMTGFILIRKHVAKWLCRARISSRQASSRE